MDYGTSGFVSYCSIVTGVNWLIIKLIDCSGNPQNENEQVCSFTNILVTKNRPISDSMFKFSENFTLVSYIPQNKNKKNIILVSSNNFDIKIDEASANAKKLEIITFYNLTKWEVVRAMMDKYCVARNSQQ